MDYLSTLNDEQLKAYINELEERLGDPCAGSSNDARDLLNAEKELKRREEEAILEKYGLD